MTALVFGQAPYETVVPVSVTFLVREYNGLDKTLTRADLFRAEPFPAWPSGFLAAPLRLRQGADQAVIGHWVIEQKPYGSTVHVEIDEPAPWLMLDAAQAKSVYPMLVSGFSTADDLPGDSLIPSGESVDEEHGPDPLEKIRAAADRAGLSLEEFMKRFDPPPPEAEPDPDAPMRGIAVGGLDKETHA